MFSIDMNSCINHRHHQHHNEADDDDDADDDMSPTLEMKSPQHNPVTTQPTSTTKRKQQRHRQLKLDPRIQLCQSHDKRTQTIDHLTCWNVYKVVLTLLWWNLFLETVQLPVNGQRASQRSADILETLPLLLAPPTSPNCTHPSCGNGSGLNAFINIFMKSDNLSSFKSRNDIDESVILKDIAHSSSVIGGDDTAKKPRNARNVQEMGQAAPIRHIPNNITINFINIQTINKKSKAKNTLLTKSALRFNETHDNTAVGNRHGHRHHEDDYNEADDDEPYAENDYDPVVGTPHDPADNAKLIQLVMDGLGLRKLPDMDKVNISQEEYTRKYREYLKRLHERQKRSIAESGNFGWMDVDESALGILSITSNATAVAEGKERRKRESRRSKHPPNSYNEKTKIFLNFPFHEAFELQPGDIEEANIRLMLIHSPALALKAKKQSGKNHEECSGNRNKTRPPKQTAVPKPLQRHMLNLKVYQLLKDNKRSWLDGRKVEVVVDRNRMDETHSQWLQFDVTKAVETWLGNRQPNLGLEVQCDNCVRIGARILNDISLASKGPGVSDDDDDGYQLLPVLNIIGRGVAQREMRTRKQEQHGSGTGNAGAHHHHRPMHDKRYKTSSNCYKENQRCCRHTMEVVFKEIKGFEFIIQPKVFDAGYCFGRCPPRYNPAHHHAMLQSLIWKQNRSRAPRPCCAPSKLVELEVLHVDEKDSEKLKISTWTDMRVIECACS